MAQEKAKYSIRLGLLNSGVFVEDANIWENSTFKLVVENAGASNSIKVYGKITGEESYHLIDSLVGNGIKNFDIKFFDFIRLTCDVYDSPTGYLKVTGSAFDSESTNAAGFSDLLGGIEYDDIQASYPNSTTELYDYFNLGVHQTQIEVTYTNSTKKYLLRARRL